MLPGRDFINPSPSDLELEELAAEGVRPHGPAAPGQPLPPRADAGRRMRAPPSSVTCCAPCKGGAAVPAAAPARSTLLACTGRPRARRPARPASVRGGSSAAPARSRHRLA
jgi:hypothetical protein